MFAERIRHHSRLAMLAAYALAAQLCTGCYVLKESVVKAPHPMEAGAVEHGRFVRVEGVGVLTLWGNPYERGFAQGRLLAPAILDMVDAVCGSNLLLTHKKDYERVILPLVERFEFEPDYELELQGIFDGVRQALGDGAVLRRLGRPLTRNDLKAYNTAGDWCRQACSTFAAWGHRTRDGHVWVGRNFDFLPVKAFFSHQMLVVHEAHEGKRAFAAVTAPGMIGCLTGINEAGVFVSVHDVFLPRRPLEGSYSPRLLVLRRLMENCSATDLAAQAVPLLEARQQMFDNAILLAAPVTDGTPPALVFEYNNDYANDRGVTVRGPAENEPELAQEMLACTNHFRKRRKQPFALADYRYPLLRRVLHAETRGEEKLGFEAARKAMGAVRLPITSHTVVADLNTLDFWFATGEFLEPPHRGDFVKLPVKSWLAGK
ncbi:MAG TPA: C45 family autoproteolytic acyltransferase/hydrolase [Planctomycetota bacterium]|nr:C45 family autoproteolytic acyltransferase/hydrolase [Planctomycetota bacterium]HRR80877.1 C45 family autoproteolytic acyltransferase/hydrolase [Planctomycetota bacterium]HRT96091.1 C45 family autoproteolytic acyltransferase/hydrolase [Planctomycetota bacterium]